VSGALLLGLDVGTTAVKAAVFDEAGAEVADGRAVTPWRTVPTGAELDPDELLDAVVEATAAALAGAPDGALAAVGVASMAETGVLIDARGRPVVPSIAWHDARGAAEARELGAALGEDTFARRTGLTVSPLCSLVKLRWMRAHWPAAARGVRWLNVAEWIVRALGGDQRAEASLSSRTGFYELETRRPWAEALEWAQAPAGLVDAHAAAGTPLGRAGASAPRRARGAVLAVGGHDHLAAAVGADAAGDGDVLDSCGTAEAWVRACAPLAADLVALAVADGISVGWHAVAGRHALLGSIRAGAVLRGVLDLLGVAPEEREALEAAALAVDPAIAGVEVSGLCDAAQTVTGVRAGVSPAVLYRATLEAVGRAGAEVLARMDAVAGPRRRLVVTGGWAAGAAARAVKTAHLGGFEHAEGISTGARGAALAAGRAAGIWEPGETPAPRDVAPSAAG
jgi:sugar (pentulose or hexulose) kinase